MVGLVRTGRDMSEQVRKGQDRACQDRRGKNRAGGDRPRQVRACLHGTGRVRKVSGQVRVGQGSRGWVGTG